MRDDTRQLVDEFIEFLKGELEVPDLPEVEFVGSDFSDREKSFASYDNGKVTVVAKNRHPMDILRSVAHEMVHHVKQHTDGSDGSPDENEANAMAGEFMRRFGKRRTDGFGMKAESVRKIKEVLSEGWGNPGALQSFYGQGEQDKDGPGFDVVNQGVVRRNPGEGPDSTADAQEMQATDRNPESQPVEIDVVPTGVSKQEMEQMFKPLKDRGFDNLYQKLTKAGAYDRFRLMPHEAQELVSVVGSFLDTRKYNRPKKQFADDLLRQLDHSMNEEMAAKHHGQNYRPDPIGSDTIWDDSMEYMDQVLKIVPEWAMDKLTPHEFDDFVESCRKNGIPASDCARSVMMTATGGLSESLSGAGENEEGFERQDMVRKAPELSEMNLPSMKEVLSLKKSTEKEKREHKWMTDDEARRVALDHEREGKS